MIARQNNQAIAVPMHRIFWTFFVTLLSFNTVIAQEVTIKLGSSMLTMGDKFSITLQCNTVALEQYGAFPDIPGFIKAGTSNNTYTQNADGENTTVYSFIQFYSPQKPGIYTLPPFKLKANGKLIPSPGTQLTVSDGTGAVPSINDAQTGSIPQTTTDEIDNLEPRGNVFFALSADRNKVYVGQGFTTTLALYVADNNTQELDFYNVAEQLQAMAQDLKPANCWEEDFGITEIQEIPVKIKGRRYSQFKIYQATYFPLNSEPITFAPVSLKMLSNTQAYTIDENNKRDFRIYATQPLRIAVQDLPEHPLKGLVPVGAFRLAEFVNKTRQRTGKSFTYKFSIRGEGNITAIKPPEVPPGIPFDIYKPSSVQSIYRSLGKVTGERTYIYNIIPQEPGIYNLGEGFQWVFFNTMTNRYDTLVSSTRIKVEGASHEPTDAYGGTTDPFYADLKERNNWLKSLDRNKVWKTYGNWAIGIMVLGFLVLLFINNRNNGVSS